eukprot:Gregarina_sp_Poly_1__4849@NODE_2581_length_1949_cov_337_827843_g1621_i1_p1_GENE_NODE_2581_length_1949_cov_337_827843_g1621_i1NODE_2581_length_1949_cov_337_827843_g1621_i1_p1_ORF_typecomplete_len395_score43_61Actin/PF00022_19/5_2e122MreB_Mbl/PF06723_13/0_0067BcrAD_BadFG/PF01869_20/98BcrAD_BadFG/PF01869_20/4_2_NODE_2581_length_1949_cov_337_827843_g1621_i1651249
MADLEDLQPVIVDNGSSTIKAGIAGRDAPSCVFPCVMGRPKHDGIVVERRDWYFPRRLGYLLKDWYFGDEAQMKRGFLQLRYPIVGGGITNWDELEALWRHIFFAELQINPENHPILLTEASLNPKSNREKMVQIIFEQFSSPSTYVCNQAALSLYASGRNVGTVIQSGDGVSHIVPIYEGFEVLGAIHRVGIAGKDLTEFLQKLLERKGYRLPTSVTFTAPDPKEIIRDMKEQLCSIALDYKEELNWRDGTNEAHKAYFLPDGGRISVGRERFQCPEALFQPNFLGQETQGIHQSTFHSVMRCDVDIRKELYSNVVLSGGTTMLEGMRERMTRELTELVPSTMQIKVIAPPKHKFSVWIGGSILSSLSTFQTFWITTEEYDESGPSIVHRKCM